MELETYVVAGPSLQSGPRNAVTTHKPCGSDEACGIIYTVQTDPADTLPVLS